MINKKEENGIFGNLYDMKCVKRYFYISHKVDIRGVLFISYSFIPFLNNIIGTYSLYSSK